MRRAFSTSLSELLFPIGGVETRNRENEGDRANVSARDRDDLGSRSPSRRTADHNVDEAPARVCAETIDTFPQGEMGRSGNE
jgi:hypothetical protein